MRPGKRRGRFRAASALQARGRRTPTHTQSGGNGLARMFRIRYLRGGARNAFAKRTEFQGLDLLGISHSA
jgi:hypothetical protein